MYIETKPFGTIEINERQIVYFPQGMLGFEANQRWALLDASQPPFYWLQSLDDKNLAFVLINPKYFRPDFDPGLSEEDRQCLELLADDDLLIFAIVNIPSEQADMTANLQGPVLINKRLLRGRQTIQTDPRWKIRHRILDELSARGAS